MHKQNKFKKCIKLFVTLIEYLVFKILNLNVLHWKTIISTIHTYFLFKQSRLWILYLHTQNHSYCVPIPSPLKSRYFNMYLMSFTPLIFQIFEIYFGHFIKIGTNLDLIRNFINWCSEYLYNYLQLLLYICTRVSNT